MAIRYVERTCSLGWEAIKTIEEATGAKVHTPDIILKDMSSEARLSTPNAQHSIPKFDNLFSITTDEVSHEGRVVAKFTEYAVRIMSDVWADLTFAVVYEPNGPEGYGSKRLLDANARGLRPADAKWRMFRNICIGNSDTYYPLSQTITVVDAPEWLKEVYAAAKAGMEFSKAEGKYDFNQNRIVNEKCEVSNGSIVRVVKGRKVKNGTEGKVFWMGDSAWGTKVGIGVPQEDGTYRMVQKQGRYGKTYESYADVEWTYLKNVVRISELGGRELHYLPI